MVKRFSYPLLVVFCFAVFPALAQRSPLRFGVKAGGSLSQLNIKNGGDYVPESNSFSPGFYAGALLEISGPAGSKLKGQVEALFQQYFQKNSGHFDGLYRNTTTRISQISVPLMIRYFPIPALSFNAGASVNFNLIAEGDHRYQYISSGEPTPLPFHYGDEDNLQPFQLGVLVGASYYLYKGLFLDARYNYLFGQLTKSEPRQWVHGFQLGIGYKFGSPN